MKGRIDCIPYVLQQLADDGTYQLTMHIGTHDWPVRERPVAADVRIFAFFLIILHVGEKSLHAFKGSRSSVTARRRTWHYIVSLLHFTFKFKTTES